MISIIGFVGFAMLNPVPADWQVVLGNGHQIDAQAVVRQGDQWKLTLAGGTVRLAARDVVAVRRCRKGFEEGRNASTFPEAAPDAAASNTVTPAEEAQATTLLPFEFELDGQLVHLPFPRGFLAADAESEKALTFVSPDGKCRIRVTSEWSSVPLWNRTAAIKSRRAAERPEYALLAEEFRDYDRRPAWFLAYRHRQELTTVSTCEGYLDGGGRTFVVTVSSIDATPPILVSLTRAIVGRLSTLERKRDPRT